MDRAGKGLYRRSRLVRHVVGDPVELGWVGYERALRPAPAGVAAEAGLYAGCDIALRDVHAQSVPSGGAVGARRVYATHSATEGRLQHDPFAGAKISSVFCHDAHDLVAEYEGRGCDRGEVRRVLRRERAQVRAADP